MGEAEPFIRFNCENCGYKSTVSESYAGKNIRCPNCYYIIFISKPESTSTTQTSPGYSAYDSSLLNIQEQNILKHREMVEYIASEQAAESEEEEEPPQETDPAALRKLPWVIDIFLYPFNWPGLKHLAIFILVPQLLNTIESILPYLLAFLFSIAAFFVKILIFLYIYWYLAECVRESAYGWIRTPHGFGGLPSGQLRYYFRVQLFQFDAGVGRSELPIHRISSSIALFLPCLNFCSQLVSGFKILSQTLPC